MFPDKRILNEFQAGCERLCDLCDECSANFGVSHAGVPTTFSGKGLYGVSGNISKEDSGFENGSDE